MRSLLKITFPYLITGITAAFCAVFLALFLVGFQDLPQVESLQDFSPKGITTLLDYKGQKAHEYFQERRIPLTFDEIPESTKQAFLAAEDWGFYDHFGIDLTGIIRASLTNVLRRKFSQGASTITQQLSRNLFLTHKKTLQRKLKEAILTLRIEKKFTKDEIFTLYLNQIYLGEGTYGIEQAAQVYFGKTVMDLTIEENALLASLPKNPNIYSPFKNPDRALDRRNLTLQMMMQRKVIDRQTMLASQEKPLPNEKQSVRTKQNYFTFSVLEQIQEQLDPSLIEKGQLIIASGYDSFLQQTMEDAAKKGLKEYMNRHKLNENSDLPQVAAVSMDVHTGAIRAIVGGVDFEKSSYNRALVSLRQPGSSIKPLLYSLAFDKGFTQSTFVLDAPIRFQHPQFGLWQPENYDGEYAGFVPLRVALEKSKNTTSVRILQELGVGPFQRWVKKLGITSDFPSDLTISLGSASVRLVEMASAFAHFANGGLLVKPHLFTQVQDKQDRTLLETKPSVKKNMDPATAFITTDAMRGVVQEGTAQFAKDLDCDLAGKTGTTNKYIDSVFVGFSSELVTVVWVGFDDNRSLGHGETGSRAAGRIWKDIMQAHCKKDQPGSFLSPHSTEWVVVDHDTGLLPSKYSQKLTRQAYRKSTAPTEDCCVPEQP